MGVLFVHGIGVRPRGSTLAEFGGPLVKWLEDWYEGFHSRWVAAGVGFEDIVRWLDGLEVRDPRQLDALRSLLDRAPRKGADAVPVEPAAAKENVGDTLAVAVRLSQATGGQPSGEDPPHVWLEWTHLRLNGTTTQTAWLLAEAWWAETFAPPSFGDLAWWALGVLPRTIGSHLGVRVRRAWGRWRQNWSLGHLAVLLGRFGALLLGLFVSLAALPLLALVLLVGLLPIPRIRESLQRLQQRIAAVLGDGYVLVVRPMEAAAIVGRVRHDLAWLADHCDQVAVVAYSQGGAILNEVLRQELAEGAVGLLPPQVPSPAGVVDPVVADDAGRDSTGTPERAGRLQLVLTFGSGLRKLHELRWLLGPGRSFRRSSFITLLGLVLFTDAAVVLALDLVDVATGRAGAGSAVGTAIWAMISGTLLAAGLVDLVAEPPHGELQWWIDQLRQTGVRWRDYAGSADPVPNGALIDEQQMFPEHMTVHNRGSLLRDHTTYWTNRDEFLPDVVVCLAELDPSISPDFKDCQDRFAFARRRRRWRVNWLIGCRWIAILTVMATLIRGWAGWLPLLSPALYKVQGFMGIETRTPPIEMAGFADALRPVAWVLAVYVVAVIAWRRLDHVETARLSASRTPAVLGMMFIFSVAALVFQGGQAAAPALATRWFMGFDVSVVVAALWIFQQQRFGVFNAPEPPGLEEEVWETTTMAEATGLSILILFILFLIGLFIVGAIGWLWAFQPAVVVLAAVIILTIALVQARRWRHRFADRRGQRGDPNDQSTRRR